MSFRVGRSCSGAAWRGRPIDNPGGNGLGPHGPRKELWAYSYEIIPPQSEEHLRAIQSLLDDEHADAKQTGRIWTGNLVYEPTITHILVVADNPDQDREINQRLEGTLKERNAVFSLTVPLAVLEEGNDTPPVDDTGGA